jgi:CRP-like cAMP-binding protein
MPEKPLARYTRSYEKGAVLFEEGQAGDCMYVIQSGRVEIVKQLGAQRVTIAVLGAGDCVGEMAVLERQPRSAGAVIAEPAELVVLDRDTFESLVRENGEIAVRIMRKLSQRLREANRQIENFLVRSGAMRAVEWLRGIAGVGRAGNPRPLPEGTTAQTLASRAGLSLQEARTVWGRLRAAGVLDDAGEPATLAPEPVVDDYLAYLELKQTYDPLTARELAELTGLSEEEVHRVARRVLDRKLADSGPLVDSYQQFLTLKRRFEYDG